MHQNGRHFHGKRMHANALLYFLFLSQVSNGYIQLRCNIGTGDHTLMLTSRKLNDLETHTIIVQRTQAALELQLDNTFINQTAIPTIQGNDDSVLLSTSPDHIYLGAEVNVATGEVQEGFKGCITGVTLDGEELPFDTAGNEDFAIVHVEFSSGNIISGCPLGTLEENDQSDLHVYAGMGAILAGVVIFSLVFVTVCAACGAWRRSRHGEHPIRSRGGSPSHSGFMWHSAYNPKSPPAPGDIFMLNPIKPAGAEEPDGRMAETSLAGNRNATRSPTHHQNRPSSAQPPSHSRQGSGIISPPVEGFSLISQPNQGFLQESPATSEDDRTTQQRLVRSPSEQPSVHSVGMTRPDPTYIPSELLGKDDVEVRKYLRKKVEVADADNEAYDVDKMEPFSEEGPFEPLGSIGSLYDFVKELDYTETKLSAHKTSVSGGLTRAPPEGTGKTVASSGKQPTSKPYQLTQSPGGGKRPRILMTTDPAHSNSKTAAARPTSPAHQPSPTKSHAFPSSASPTTPPPPTSRTNKPPTLPSPGKRPRVLVVDSNAPVSPTRSSHQQLLLQNGTSPVKFSASQEIPASISPESHPPPPPPHTTGGSPRKPEAATENGLWVPVNKHSRSASQPDPPSASSHLPGMSSKDPTRLRRSGRRSHRVMDQSRAPINNILEKFHQATANASGHRAMNGAKEETIVL